MGDEMKTCILLIAIVGADKPVDNRFRSVTAINAVREYNKTVAIASEVFGAKEKPARDKLIQRLKFVLLVATKSGDLAEANKLQSSIKALERNPNPPNEIAAPRPAQPAAVQRPFGTWHARYVRQSLTRVYRFGDDGSVTLNADNRVYNGKVVSRGGTLFIDLGDRDTNRLTIVGERMFVEHWKGQEMKGFAFDVASGFRVK